MGRRVAEVARGGKFRGLAGVIDGGGSDLWEY